MIGCDCRTCQSRDPRDQRLRTSALIEHRGLNVVIDTSADFRAQMLEARLTHLEAVLYTHQHYDHIAGFDDLRAFQFLRRVAPTCYANVATYDHIRKAFDYAFGHATQHGGGLPQVPFEVIDEAALFAALKERRIGGAIIDTLWVYPTAADPAPWPSSLPFRTLDNCVVTSHMSGWSQGMVRRRQETMAENIRRLARGEPLLNKV